MTRNVTLAIDAQLLISARKLALEHGTSVNKLIREYLQRLVNEADNAHAEADAWISHAMAHEGNSHGDRWTREELNER